jgi:hypothetical protein
MPSSGMLRHVALVSTDFSEKHSASIIRVTRIGDLRTLAVSSNRIGELGTTLAVTINRLTLRRNTE